MSLPKVFGQVGEEPDKFADPKAHAEWERRLRTATTQARSDKANQARAGRAFRRALRRGAAWAIKAQDAGEGIVGPGIVNTMDFNNQVAATVAAKAADDKQAAAEFRNLQNDKKDPARLQQGDIPKSETAPPPGDETPAQREQREKGEAAEAQKAAVGAAADIAQVDLTGEDVGRASGPLLDARQQFMVALGDVDSDLEAGGEGRSLDDMLTKARSLGITDDSFAAAVEREGLTRIGQKLEAEKESKEESKAAQETKAKAERLKATEQGLIDRGILTPGLVEDTKREAERAKDQILQSRRWDVEDGQMVERKPMELNPRMAQTPDLFDSNSLESKVAAPSGKKVKSKKVTRSSKPGEWDGSGAIPVLPDGKPVADDPFQILANA